MRRAVASALISGLCLTLTACSHHEAAGPPPTGHDSTGPSVTGPATTGSTSSDPPRDTPPVMPPLAKEKSTAGAKAFIRYFVEVLNYSHVAESTQRLRRLSASDCAVCKAIASAIEEMRRRGGRQEGAEWVILGLGSLPSSESNLFNLVADIRINRGSTRRSSGAQIQHIRAAQVHDDFFLVWQTGTWLLRDLRPT
jgi:hypothetical protein